MTTDRATNRTLPRLGALAVAALVLVACSGSEDGPADTTGSAGTDVESSGSTIPDDVDAILDASADSMGGVTSVAFDLSPSGAPVYLDQFDALAVDAVAGQVIVDEAAAAVIGVEVNGSLNTELGAVAVDDEVLLTNPVTGRYEPLPPGIDIDPSMFFDPENGWRPLLADLVDAQSLGIEERRGANRYHVAGTAPAERIEIITAGLVKDQEVEIDFWIDPATGLVSDAEFTATFDGEDVDWTLALDEYGRDFDIEVPDELRGDG